MKLLQQIFKQFPYSPTTSQQSSIQLFSSYLTAKNSKAVFLLKGYAGTGKTILIATWMKSLKPMGFRIVLMAPTGRAAKVMSNYASSKAYTIHKRIYFAQQNKQGAIKFKLQKNKHRKTIFIVDEASMIADNQQYAKLFENGSLLNDLIEYVSSGDDCKLVLVGDTAQLPPVKQELSPALDKTFLETSFQLDVHESELNEVVRQSSNSGILTNATALRKIIQSGVGSSFSFEVKQTDDVVRMLDGYEIQGALEDAYREVGRTETTIIVRSNKRANLYNRQIRTQIMGLENALAVGDLVMVVKNNYFWLPTNSSAGFIANGDVLEVLRISAFKELYGFQFAEVQVRLVDYDDQPPFDTVLILDTLDSETHALTAEQSNSLYTQVRQDYGHLPQYKQYTEVKKNPFFNALQVKFAYAVTCHKAQGGQWKRVFVEQPYLPEGPSIAYYRWLYTAITRASDKLYLIGFGEDYFSKD
ncbi:MAG: ATP-dependent DNA helicase [Flavobacteriaceae bacterium]